MFNDISIISVQLTHADGDDDKKREELKPFNFEEEMGTLCKRFQLSHAH